MAGRYSPINPVCQGDSTPCPNEVDSTVGSLVVGNNSDLLRAACSLWVPPASRVLDMTYGKGGFWKWDHGLEVVAHDLKIDGVSLTNLPEDDSSEEAVVLDPPYRPTHGGSAQSDFVDRYGVGGVVAPDTIDEVLGLYRAGLREGRRVCRDGAVMMVKTQDLSYGHKLHLVTLDVLKIMIEEGFEFVDQFILGSPSGARRGRQERAHRKHSVLWVGVAA